MLGDKEAVAMVAVKDLAKAAAFYGDILGLTVLGKQGDEVITYRSGSSKINIYKSEFAGTNKATAALWNIGSEIADVARALAGKGVNFEHYTMPGLTLEGDLYVGAGMKVAWFKDPDGNILSITGV